MDADDEPDVSPQYDALANLVSSRTAAGANGGGKIIINPHARDPSERREVTRDELIAASGRHSHPEQLRAALAGSSPGFVPPTAAVGLADTGVVSVQRPAVPTGGVRSESFQGRTAELTALPTPPAAASPLVVRFDLGPYGAQTGRYDIVQLDGPHLLLAFRHDSPYGYVPPVRTPRDPQGPVRVYLPEVAEPIPAFFVGTRVSFLGYELVVLHVSRRHEAGPPAGPLGGDREDSRW